MLLPLLMNNLMGALPINPATRFPPSSVSLLELPGALSARPTTAVSDYGPATTAASSTVLASAVSLLLG